jgi:O-antigen/teichoic acid export membrane protein
MGRKLQRVQHRQTECYDGRLPLMTSSSAINTTGLREKSIRSAVWMCGLQGLVGLLYFGVPLVLSYLVTPAEMGLMELAIVVYAISVFAVELGADKAVVQRTEITPRLLATVFWVNVAIGVLLALLLFVAAPWMTRFLRADASLVPLLRGIGPALILQSLGVVPRGLLARRMEFRRLTIASVLGIVPAVIAASLGLAWKGVSGVLYGMLVLTSITSAAMWLASGYRPAWAFDRSEIARVLRFGSSASLGTAAEMLGVLVERFLMARFFGTASVGLWGLTRSLAREPLRRIMVVFDEVLFPGLASLQGDLERSRRYYLTVVRYELAIFGPAVVFIAVFAPELTALFYGDAWLGVAVLAQLLVLQSWRTVTVHSVGAVLLARGRPDVRLWWVLVSVAFTPVMFFAGKPWGLPGYAASCSLIGFVVWVISHTMANRLIDLHWPRFLRAMAAPLLAHVAFALILIAVRHGLRNVIAARGSDTVLLVIVPAMAVYLAVLWTVDRPLLTGVLTALREGLRLRRPASPEDARTRSPEVAC